MFWSSLRSMTMVLLLGWGATACATPQQSAKPEQLYFALELRHEGRLVGQPKLLGETGKVIRAERRSPGAPAPDYRLVLTPVEAPGELFEVKLDLAVPRASGHFKFDLLHGQEQRLQLGPSAGPLEVKLLFMKVDSPEFRALMDLPEPLVVQAI